jgi:hypothetical protein
VAAEKKKVPHETRGAVRKTDKSEPRTTAHEQRYGAGPLSAKDLATANAASCKSKDYVKGGKVVAEPASNVYGRFKVLRRVDGLFVVHDTKAWPPNGHVFASEAEARVVAQSMASPK